MLGRRYRRLRTRNESSTVGRLFDVGNRPNIVSMDCKAHTQVMEWKTHSRHARPPFECVALLLQGGGALGAYQGGVYRALAEGQLELRELGPGLEYGGAAECKSMTVRLGPVRTTGNLAAALTCRKVNRKNAVLL